MSTKPVAKDLRRRSSVVRFYQISAQRLVKPLLAGMAFAAVLASAFAGTTANAANAVGAIAASAGVSATGAATYSIPISLPPGTNGMQPSLALVYNSQSGDGLAGYGWTLGGLSAITRCPKTIDDDGVTQAIQYSNSDDYCLDGQRLRLVSGTYGTDGATYATVIQGFSLITSHVDANATSGPSWFTVQTKDGKIFEYGNTTDSKIYAQNTHYLGTNIVRVWALDKVTDLNGNYYTATYQNNGDSTGEYWPSTISYTGNGSTTPDHQISFGYQARPTNTVQIAFVHGSQVINSQLLKTITVTYIPTNEATFTYNLVYMQDAANGRNQLHTVQECGKDGTCLPMTTIGWQSGQSDWGSNTPTGGGVSDLVHAQAAHLMDVDGDGIQDLVYPAQIPCSSPPNCPYDWFVMFGQPGGGFTAPVDTGDPLWGDATYYAYALALDYNGDGRMDLMVPIPSGWQILVATGSRSQGVGNIFKTPGNNLPYLGGTNSVTGLPIYEGNVWAVDFSGRGLSDLVYTDGTTMWLAKNSGPAGGESFSAAQPIYTDNGLSKSVAQSLIDVPVSFDGSGRGGAIALKTSALELEAFASTEQPAPAFQQLGPIYPAAGPVIPLDLNADGLTDILVTNPASGNDWQFNRNIGTGFEYIDTGVVNNYPNTDQVVADYFGDGRKEVFEQATSSNSWDMIQLTYAGVNTTANLQPSYPSTYAKGTLRIGNIEANGLDDLVFAEANTNGTYTWYYRLHNGGAADLVTGITDGFGNTCQFKYASIAAGGPTYTEAGSPAVYPVRYAQSPMQVVSSYTETDGSGGTDTLTYTYTSARFESQGRGFLGFVSRTISDAFRGTTETITYDQTFPWIGMVTSDVLTRGMGGTPISSTMNSGAEVFGYTGSNTCATICFPFFDTSTTTVSSNNGTANQTVSTTTSTLSQSSFDAYGNVIGEQTTVVDGGTSKNFSSSLSASYSTDTSTYCIGLSTGSEVSKSTPGNSLSRIVNGYPSTPTADVDTAHCRLNSLTVASGEGDGTTLTTAYQYDAFGNVTQTDVTGSGIPATRITKFDYAGGNDEFPTTVTHVVSPTLSLATTATWDYSLGEKVTDTDANGKTTSYGYDAFGREASVTRPDSSKTQLAYAWCNAPTPGVSCPSTGSYEITTSQVSSTGNAITTGYTAYDTRGRPVEQGTVLLGGVMSLVDTTYDSVGHVLNVTRPYFKGQATVYNTSYAYDNTFNRLTSVTQPVDATDTGSVNDVTTFSYNENGTGFGVTATRNVTGPGGGTPQVTTKYTDALGETVQMVDAKQGTTSYTYDAFGDLSATTDADGNVTHLYYDGLGHKTSMVDPDMGTWSYQVDALGEVLCQTDAKNQSIIMGYDGLGRVTSKLEAAAGAGCTATAGTSSTWTYDQTGALGLPASVSDSNGFQRVYGYDAFERPDDVTTTIGGTPYDISTGYDYFGRVQTVTYPASVTPAASTGPTAVATATPTTVGGGGTVNLDGSGSTDPNGDPYQCVWSVASQPAGSNIAIADPDQCKTTAVPEQSGAYTLQLVVNDANASSTPVTVAISSVVPSSPTNLTFSAPYSTSGSYTLSWTAPTGVYVAGYYVYESVNGGSFTNVTPSGLSNTTKSYPFSSKGNGSYSYYVVAYNGAGPGAPSATVSESVYLPPGAPYGLGLSSPNPSTNGTVTFGWQAPTGTTTFYEAFESSGGTFSMVKTTANTGINITGLGNGNYTFYVVACNTTRSCGNQSGQISSGVLLSPGAPGLSVNFSVIASGGTVTLSWNNPGGTVTYYKLSKYSTNKNTTTTINVGNVRSYNQTLTVADYLDYNVQACNTASCGGWSNTVQVQVTGGSGGGGCKTCSPLAPTGGTTTAPSSGTTSGPMSFVDPVKASSSQDSRMVTATPMLASATPQGKTPGVDIAPTVSAGHQAPVQNAVISILQNQRRLLNDRAINPESEAQLQALVVKHEREALPAVVPQSTMEDVAAWERADAKRSPPNPRYAAPAYLAYAGARMVPATGTPYRFQVSYTYDPTSGALMSVANAQTGFIYWEAATNNGSTAPVDPFGHLLAYTDGNNVSTINTYDGATGVITGISTGVGPSSSVQQLIYSWGAFGNLQQRCDANRGLVEQFTYDNLNRLRTSNVNTGAAVGNCTTPGPNAGPALSVTYDNVGNIQTLNNSGNTGVGGTYSYDPNHPHAVSTVSNVAGTYTYDADGNMVSGPNGRSATWNDDNLPTQINGANGSSTFSYGPDLQRYQQVTTDSVAGNSTTTYVGGLFEVISTSSTTQYRHNILAGGQVVAVHTLDQAGNETTSYVHSDHLGSSDTLTNDQGNIAIDPVTHVQQVMSFDVFGLRRDPNNWSYDLTGSQVAGLKSFTDRGYTNQEQLDNVGLVDMNGRVYDPSIGRFVSADPTVPNPNYSQAFNRYMYVYGNPLAMADPSGFDSVKCSTAGCDKCIESCPKPPPMTGSHIPGVDTGASCSGNCGNFGGNGGNTNSGNNGNQGSGGGGDDASNGSSGGDANGQNSAQNDNYASSNNETITTIFGCNGPNSTGTCWLWQQIGNGPNLEIGLGMFLFSDFGDTSANQGEGPPAGRPRPAGPAARGPQFIYDKGVQPICPECYVLPAMKAISLLPTLIGALKTIDSETELRPITFGHGARHLIGTPLSTDAVEAQIVEAIRSIPPSAISDEGEFWGQLDVSGYIIQYKAYPVPDGPINVGTYWPVQ